MKTHPPTTISAIRTIISKHRSSILILAIIFGLGLFGLVAWSSSGQGGTEQIFAHDRFANRLMTFNANAPGVFTSNIPITGLNAGEQIVGIDFRPADGLLYGVGTTGSASRLLRINTTTGAGTPVGTGFTPVLSTSTFYGLDFHPTIDPLRIVNFNGLNIRISPVNGTVSGTGANLAYVPGDPNFGLIPRVDMIAYVDSPQGTVLLGVDTARGQTVRIGATGGSPPGEDTSPEGGTDEADQGGCRSEGPTRAPDQSSSDLEKATFATNQAYGVINDILLRIAASGGARTAVGPVPASPNIDGIAIRPATATPTPTATPTSTPTPTPAATPTPTPPPVTLSIPYIAVGHGSGTLATGVYGPTGNLLTSFSKFPGFTGEVRVATGDVNGDGRLDIIGGQGSMSAWVRALSGMNQTELFAYDAFPGFTGGIYVAAGDINGDGRDDVIVGAGPGGGGQVKVFSGMDNALIRNFNAYAAGFTGGVRVAAGDIDNDGRADIVTGPSSGGPTNVKVFSGATGAEIRSFVAYTGFTGGVFVAAGDVNGDGSDDIITGADSGGAPHVKIFSGVNPSTELASFNAFSPSFTGGVRVSGGDVNRDGLADVVVGTGPGGLARVIVFNVVTGTTFVDFVPYDDVFRPEGSGFEGGIYVTAAAPTPVRVSGSVTTPDGRGLRNAIVFLTDPQMVTRQTTTSSFGFFTFENVPAGGPYNLRVNSRRYRFVSRTVTLNGDLTNVNFVGIE